MALNNRLKRAMNVKFPVKLNRVSRFEPMPAAPEHSRLPTSQEQSRNREVIIQRIERLTKRDGKERNKRSEVK